MDADPIFARFTLACRRQAALDRGDYAAAAEWYRQWQAVRWEKYPSQRVELDEREPVSPIDI